MGNKTVDEIWEDIQFDKQIVTLVEERKVDELMKLMANGGIEKLMNMDMDRVIRDYRIWQVFSTVIPEPPLLKWQDVWVDSEARESFTVEEWKREGKEFLRVHKVTRMESTVYNGRLLIRVYHAVKERKRVLVNLDEVKAWVNSLTEEQKQFIIKLYDLVMDRSFEKEVWLMWYGDKNDRKDIALVECYWKLWNKFKPKVYRPYEIWDDDHDREPYGHWVR